MGAKSIGLVLLQSHMPVLYYLPPLMVMDVYLKQMAIASHKKNSISSTLIIIVPLQWLLHGNNYVTEWSLHPV